MKKIILSLLLLATVTVLAFDPNNYSNSKQQEQLRIAYTGYCKGGTVIAHNCGSSTVYLLIIDTNATPAASAVTTIPAVSVPAGSTASVVFPGGRFFNYGIVAAFSTNDTAYMGTYTNGWFDVTFSKQ